MISFASNRNQPWEPWQAEREPATTSNRRNACMHACRVLSPSPPFMFFSWISRQAAAAAWYRQLALRSRGRYQTSHVYDVCTRSDTTTRSNIMNTQQDNRCIRTLTRNTSYILKKHTRTPFLPDHLGPRLNIISYRVYVDNPGIYFF